MSEQFSLLWGKILNSSLWVQGSKETRLVWITMLAMKDSEGVVRAAVVGLADRAKVTVDECRKALNVLLSPDPEDTSKVEEGRRIREVPGGWQLINHEMYRFSSEEKRAYWAQKQAESRARKLAAASKGGKSTKESRKAKQIRLREDAREARFVAAEQAGDLERAGRIAAGEE